MQESLSNHRVVLRLILTLVVTGAVAEAALAQRAIDRIRRRTGVDTGKITKVSALEVTITKNGVESKVPVEEIESIYFGGEPSELSQARQAIARGRPQDAIDKLKDVEPGSLVRDEVKQELDYLNLQAREKLASSGQSSLGTVIKLAEDFVSRHRNSYHVSSVIEIQGNAQLARGKTDEALRQYRKLAKAPAPYFQARSALLIGRVLQQQGEHKEALSQFDKAIAAAKKSPAAEPQLLEATLYRAVSQSAQGEVDSATKVVKEIITKAEPEDTKLLAAAYNALGDCYLQSDKQKAARDAYLHVDVLFSSDPDQHAKSLYELSKLWSELGHEQRSRAARDQLLKEYPASRWAQK